MKKKFKDKIFISLILISIIGGFFRFWQLSNYPVSLSIDEVAVGYNSYSILKTARDEYGKFLPLAFKSVGDYKAPILIYLNIPAIAIFGLNEFGVRFSIALISTLTIFLIYLLINQITKNKRLAFIGAFSLAISPWHIYFSRFTHDAILGLFFVLLGVYLFLNSLEKKGKFLWLSAIFFGLSIYSYHAERVFTPLIGLTLLIIYREKLLLCKNQLFKAALIFLVIMIPFLKLVTGPEVQTRARMTFIAQDENISYQLHQQGDNLNLTEKIFDNNLIILGNFWVKRYLNYWDPSFLFFKGMDFTQAGAPDTGILYLFELPFFALGLYFLFFKDIVKIPESKKLIIAWLLIGPVAASLANNDQHPSRSLTTIPIPQIIIAIGFYVFVLFVMKLDFKKRILSLLVFVAILIFNLIYVTDLYFVHYPIQFSENWDYGYKEAALFVKDYGNKYEEIVIDNAFGSLGPYTVGTPHLYMLFYNKYDPSKSQSERGQNSENFSRFKFRNIYWPEDRYKKNTLFIGSPWSLPLKDLKEEQILRKIYFKNHQLGFIIVETK